MTIPVPGLGTLGDDNDTSLTDGAFVAQTGSTCRQIRLQKHLHKIVQFRLDLPEIFDQP